MARHRRHGLGAAGEGHHRRPPPGHHHAGRPPADPRVRRRLAPPRHRVHAGGGAAGREPRPDARGAVPPQGGDAGARRGFGCAAGHDDGLEAALLRGVARDGRHERHGQRGLVRVGAPLRRHRRPSRQEHGLAGLRDGHLHPRPLCSRQLGDGRAGGSVGPRRREGVRGGAVPACERRGGPAHRGVWHRPRVSAPHHAAEEAGARPRRGHVLLGGRAGPRVHLRHAEGGLCHVGRGGVPAPLARHALPQLRRLKRHCPRRHPLPLPL
mmetsp:Transcript_26748/g.64642  ORF Transcript_26748/g.64642 Transcript_26748/m.64642 type:complete len:267 (-) Transcript_26748:731-1531(-)